MSEINMLVRVTANEESLTTLKGEMCLVQAATQAEEGCLRYQFYQDRKSPTMFYVQESYANKEAFIIHANSAHMSSYLEATKKMVVSVDMHKVDPVL